MTRPELEALAVSDEYLETAVEAVLSASEAISTVSDEYDLTYKEGTDFATDADYAAEQAIEDVLHREYPSHEILSEEGGVTGNSPNQWIVDPIDGTVNFHHKTLDWCILVALERDGELHTGVTYNPSSAELIYSVRGKGAYRLRDEEPVTVSSVKGVESSLVASDFVATAVDDPDYVSFYKDLQTRTHGVRQLVCGGMNGVRVATGELEAQVEYDANPWDLAPGVLHVREAGGHVTDLAGNSEWSEIKPGTAVLTNGNIHEDILDMHG